MSPPQGCGEALRSAREQSGLSLQDVSQRLKMPVRVLQALEAGRRYVEEHIPDRNELQLQPDTRLGDSIVMSGNQAISMGAIVAGCRRYAGYPITPATDIMEFLAAQFPQQIAKPPAMRPRPESGAGA